MARTLGLDLGSYSIKALWLENTMRTQTMRGFSQVRLPPAGETHADLLARMQTAMLELLSSVPLPVDQVVVALPGPSVATHSLSLPFVDPKRIEATLPFELESQLPFDLSECIFDYQLASSNDKKSELLLGVVRKAELSALLSMLQGAKVEPRIISHPALVLFNLLEEGNSNRAASESEFASAIIDLGHERTNVAIGRVGTGVEMARTFAAGGKDITRAIAQEFQVSFEEAERWKESNAAAGTDFGYGPDAERAHAACLKGLASILRELRPTLKAYAARTHVPIQRLVLAGGTSLLKGIDELFAKELGIQTERLVLPVSSANPLDSQAAPIAGEACALALKGLAPSTKNNRFNLRRGEFAFKGDLDYVKDKVPHLAALGLALLFMLFSSGWVRTYLLSQRRKEMEVQFCEATENIIGRCEKNYDMALALLKGQESPAASIPKVSAVNLLAELTQRLPGDVPITMDRLDVEMDRISIRIETDSTKNVDKITTALRAYRCFKEVQEGKIEKSPDGQKVSVQLKIDVECPTTDEAQG